MKNDNEKKGLDWYESKSNKFIKYVKNNKVITIVLSLSVLLNISTLGNTSKYETLVDEHNSLVKEYESLDKEYKELDKKYNTTTEENKELQSKVDEASPWFEMKEEERKAEQEKLEAEKKAKEEAEQKAKEEQEAKEKAEQEAKEKQGYDTGITYSQLARTPDEYKGEKCKFSGKVIQVMEDEGLYTIRLAVNGSYDNVILVIASTKVSESRILEDDYITVYGTSSGITTYTTVMGASVSIPSMLVTKVDM